MSHESSPFDRSIQEQIVINQKRTPTERFQALCELLDLAKIMAPTDAEARQRRKRLHEARIMDKEQLRAFCRRAIATGCGDPPTGV